MPTVRKSAAHKPPTVQERKFVHRWMRTGNASDAYRYAYSADANPKTAATNGLAVLRRPHVKRFVELLNAAADEKLERARAQADLPVATEVRSAKPPPGIGARPPPTHSGTSLTEMAGAIAADKDWIARRLTALASVNARDFLSWGPKGVIIKDSAALTEAQAYGVAEVSMTMTKGGHKNVRLKFMDKEKALVDLAKLMGFTRDDEPPTPPAEAVARREQARNRIIAMLADLAQPQPLTIEADADADGALARGAVEPRGSDGV